MNTFSQYASYDLPPLAPPPYLFGIVWPILYALIAISYGFVFYKAIKKEISWKLIIPFVINLLANFLYTYLQFTVGNLALAAIDVVVVLITIIITMRVIWQHYRWVAYLQIPYLTWVMFATYLQIGIAVLNR